MIGNILHIPQNTEKFYFTEGFEKKNDPQRDLTENVTGLSFKCNCNFLYDLRNTVTVENFKMNAFS